MSSDTRMPRPPGAWPESDAEDAAPATPSESTGTAAIPSQSNENGPVNLRGGSGGGRAPSQPTTAIPLPTTSRRAPAAKLFAVFGRTGTGKTSLIELITGQTLGVGHHLPSFTEKVREVPCWIDGQQVILVDTPGFNDTNLSDYEILREIANWMAETYDAGTLLSGIIYLHRISDNRMDGSENLNLRMFKKLCGRNNLKNVILGTTMWELTPAADAQRRENDLKAEFWKDMIEQGSVVERVYRNAEAAKTLVRKLLNNTPMITRLQEQISAGNRLTETDAGAEMTAEISRLEVRVMKKIEDAQKEANELKQGDVETQNDLRAEIRALNTQMDRLQAGRTVITSWKPPPKLPRVRSRGFLTSKWYCAYCDCKTHKIGRWTCPRCDGKQRNVW